MSQRRNKVEIIYDILSLIQRKGGKVKPTHALYGGNLSYERLKSYIKEMEEKGLVTVVQENGNTFYKITEKGHDFVNEFKRIKEITEAFGL